MVDKVEKVESVEKVEKVEDLGSFGPLLRRQVTVNSRFNRRRDKAFSSDLPSMTQQHCAAETDLNNLVDKNMRFKDPAFLTKLQLMGAGKRNEPLYGDFTEVGDLQSAFDTVKRASDLFMSLPSDVRSRFDNDPVKLMDFAQNPDNFDEGVKLGIFKAKDPDMVFATAEGAVKATGDASALADVSQAASQSPGKAGVDTVSGVPETSAQSAT